MKNYYKILGVNSNADSESIKHAYFLKIKKYHPDTYQGDRVFAENKTAEINEAYDILKDENLRKKYDIKIKVLKNEKNESNLFINFFKKIGLSIAGFFVNIYKFFKNKKEQKKLKKLQKKYKQEKFSKEELESINDKKKLNTIITVMVISIVAILIILLI